MKAINRQATICQTKVPNTLSNHFDVDDDVEALLSVRFFCDVF